MGENNMSAFYRAKYDEVWRLLEDRESDDYLEPCAELLRDEYLPLGFRVTLQYLHSFASDHPELDLERALEIHQKIEDSISHERLERLPWMSKIKEKIDEELRNLRGDNDDQMGEAQTVWTRPEPEDSMALPTPTLPLREGFASFDLSSVSGSSTMQPRTTTSLTGPTLDVSAVDEPKETPSSPVVHPAVQQMEDDAEMMLMPSSPTQDIRQDAGSYTNISNIAHTSTAPRRVDDTILKRARESFEEEVSDDGQKRKKTKDEKGEAP